MFLDVLRAGLVGAEPLVPVSEEEFPDDVPGHHLHVLRPLHPPGQDLLVYTRETPSGETETEISFKLMKVHFKKISASEQLGETNFINENNGLQVNERT